MDSPQINRISSRVMIVLSLIALLSVLSGFFQSPQPDEGAAAHIFQISIAALVLTLLLFCATADWKRPLLGGRPLAFSAVTVIVAFGALYFLEHYR